MSDMFESFANSERYKTADPTVNITFEFESFANSERYKTLKHKTTTLWCLRALLIQKDTKLHGVICDIGDSLRALLIQKDTKLIDLL